VLPLHKQALLVQGTKDQELAMAEEEFNCRRHVAKRTLPELDSEPISSLLLLYQSRDAVRV